MLAKKMGWETAPTPFFYLFFLFLFHRDELNCDDEEIVRNSIHLRWIGVRRDLKELFQHTAIADDWHHQNLSI